MAKRQAQNYVYAENPDPKYCKKCRYCKQIIDKKATICPFCKKSQPLIPPLACIIILAVIIGLIIHFYEPTDSTDNANSGNNTSISSENTSEE